MLTTTRSLKRSFTTTFNTMSSLSPSKSQRWINTDLTISTLHSNYTNNLQTVTSTMEQLLTKRDTSISNSDNIFIYPLPKSSILTKSNHLDSLLKSSLTSSNPSDLSHLLSKYPLFGIPFAIKDNIDVQGYPTTAGCPGYAYTASSTAPCVDIIESLGGILIGKTNMDQFATGLVGTRSPYGTARNRFNSALIPGGSSSGSACAVSHNLCTFALGTDTAGSGRVPAGLNGLIGLKPSRNLISSEGVVPACKSLDCVSVFANNISDASTVLTSVTAAAAANKGGGELLLNESVYGDGKVGYKVGIPKGILNKDSLSYYFCGNSEYYGKYVGMIDSIMGDGNGNGSVVEIDFEPFFKVARLLYEGPWVCERLWALPFLANKESGMEGVDSTVQEIIRKGLNFTGTDVFDAQYKLEKMRNDIFKNIIDKHKIDILCVPTIPTSYTIDEINNNPIKLNSNLGLYTNFVNLLDMCAIVIPTTMIEHKSNENKGYNEPCSVTLIATKNNDLKMIDIASNIELNYFSNDREMQTAVIGQNSEISKKSSGIKYEIAVCGAHMQGFPLNYELIERNAKFVCRNYTKRGKYEMYSLENGKKPGMIKKTVNNDNNSDDLRMEIEIWAFENGKDYADFIANCVKKPLCIGTIELENGRECKGFLMESYMLEEKEKEKEKEGNNIENITNYEGWRAYKNTQKTEVKQSKL